MSGSNGSRWELSQRGNCLESNYLGDNCTGANYTKRNCPRTHIYTNGEFKSKTGRRNEYRYKGFAFVSSVLNIFTLISGDSCSCSKSSIKHLAKLASIGVNNEEKIHLYISKVLRFCFTLVTPNESTVFFT